ncbi:hypothetical protein RAS2_01240 [Phycisphaerae bacterium RAS2]|nr:hypothetical protein RAS2_01240 [Phycisphaerae bacterium RAS2]
MVDWRQHFTRDPNVCHGQLCAKGTRVLITNILDSLAEGATRDEILASYPSLRVEHVEAAMCYAAELAREESILPVTDL